MKLLRLSLPFVWVAATLLVFPFHWSLLPWIAAAGVIGLSLTPEIGRIDLRLLTGAGFLGGILASVLSTPLLSLIAVPIAGAIVGTIAILVMTPVVGAAELVRARPGSLLDGVSIRFTWIAAALVSQIFVVWGSNLGLPFDHAVPSLIASSAIVCGCAVADAWRLLRLARWRRDLGTGGIQYGFAVGGSPYRPESQVTTIVRGDLRRTRAILCRHVAFDVGALLLTAGLLAGITGHLKT